MADNTSPAAAPAEGSNSGIASWFPSGSGDSSGWRLDVVTLLAVIGESSVADHSQAITSSFLCLLPRIIPAPQALLKPDRPGRMPEINAKMAGVYSGVVLDSVGFFANIIVPLDQMQPFSFKILHIWHTNPGEKGGPVLPCSPDSTSRFDSLKSWFRPNRGSSKEKGSGTLRHQRQQQQQPPNGPRHDGRTTATDVPFCADTEHGGPHPGLGVARRPTTNGRMATFREKMTDYLARPTLATKNLRPAVPAALYSPVHILSVFSFLLTLALLGCAAYFRDGTAILAIALISLATSVVCYANWWRPLLMMRAHTNQVPAGDVVIRTREGAFVLVRCTEEVARELYSGTEECKYYVGEQMYKALMGLGTVVLMVAVVLLGNTNFALQVAVSVSYVTLNGLYWAMGLLPKTYFWDLSRYSWEDITPADARDAHTTTDERDPREGVKSYTRTLWYVIRETRRNGWVERSGAAPGTAQWKQWLQEAVEAAKMNNRRWGAVERKNQIMKAVEEPPDVQDDGQWSAQSRRDADKGGQGRGDGKDGPGAVREEQKRSEPIHDEAAQHAPVQEIQRRTTGRLTDSTF